MDVAVGQFKYLNVFLESNSARENGVKSLMETAEAPLRICHLLIKGARRERV